MTTSREPAMRCLHACCEPDHPRAEYRRRPHSIGPDAVATNGALILRLGGLGEGLPPFPQKHAEKATRWLAGEGFTPAGYTSLCALAAWAGPHDPDAWGRAEQRPGRAGYFGPLLDLNLLAMAAGPLAAHFLPGASVEVLTQGDRALFRGEGFALVVMAVSPVPGCPPAPEASPPLPLAADDPDGGVRAALVPLARGGLLTTLRNLAHNLVAHPIAGVLWALGLRRWGDAVHDTIG